MHHRRALGGAFLALALILGGLAGWRLLAEPAAGAPREAAQDPPVTVTLAAAEARDVPIWRGGLGNVQAFQTVTIRPRVDGQLDRVAFTEGQDVQQGDLLVQIDPRPFQASLDQAVAQKARDEALLANARLDLQRYTTLSQTQGASRQQLDTQRATVAQTEATIQADQASIDNARTQLGYTRIEAPIAGRLGVRLVDPGNIVHAADTTGLVVITQIHPIALFFTLPQDDLTEVLRRQREAVGNAPPAPAPGGGPEEPAYKGLPVQALTRDGRVLSEGRLLLADNRIDPNSGTIQLKAAFPNQDDALWPGQLLSARLLLETRRGVVTVPPAAVQRGLEGPFVFVAKADGTVEMRKVRPGAVSEGVMIVEEGLKPGEQVVTDGVQRLRPGARVRPAGAQAGAQPGAGQGPRG
ncbi:efflux RND transporter periplasmic adaptor subunit [Paracraurococcus lichenis]|uniref:Efflux RND transporter periplasmic adaptor subunit n=1 Tax=Paracraurococcus lichenis TaxID=3064888 RepID=A0ABT9DY98_9PROT|nr:efflux RND transporter periplasmic adaptor subunit [Paracraurococcus sp. LOR1-02]MDO9708858.1 efflux RND transporter periplasmic adaptor subunit [Paracraurococcus sp. LOR1-02]